MAIAISEYFSYASCVCLIRIMHIPHIVMIPLRKQMIENMQLRGFSEGTQTTYIQAISQLSKHYDKPPEQINERDTKKKHLKLVKWILHKNQPNRRRS